MGQDSVHPKKMHEIFFGVLSFQKFARHHASDALQMCLGERVANGLVGRDG